MGAWFAFFANLVSSMSALSALIVIEPKQCFKLSYRFAREPRWSETGDRYIIKLFRDYVFHQVDENGNPIINLSHVLTCLNKVLPVHLSEQVLMILLARCWHR